MDVDDRLHIQVGEREFMTRRSTLADRTKFFQAIFSGKWSDNGNISEFFLDADGDAFAHVLRYCRHGTMPLLYDAATNSHDYATYGIILEQAKMLGIDDLQEYLQEMRYLEAMQNEYVKVSAKTGFGVRMPDRASMFKTVDMVNYGFNGEEAQSTRKITQEQMYMRTVYNHRACLGHVGAEMPKKLGKKKEIKKRKRSLLSTY